MLLTSYVPPANCYAAPMKLKIELEREEDGRWIAEVVDLPGVLVYGADPEEALRAARALALQVLAGGALPFTPLIPNEETIGALKAARRGELVTVGGVDDLLADLHADD